MLILIFSSLFLLSQCHYGLVSLNEVSRYEIKPIYVEPVFSEVSTRTAPHVLWVEIQKAIAKHPQLKLTSAEDSQTIVKTSLVSETLSPAGTTFTNPADESIASNKAQNYSKDEILSLKVHVQLVDRASGKNIFQKTYRYNEQYLSIIASAPDELKHLHSLENREYFYRLTAARVASNFVDDLFWNP